MKVSLIGPIWLTIAYLSGMAGALLAAQPFEVEAITMFGLDPVSATARPRYPRWFRIGLWTVALSFALQTGWVWWEWWTKGGGR